MLGKEILSEIDRTLDQLIKNAEVLNEASLDDLSELELCAFQKTQESLLAHLLHMDTMLEHRRKSIKQINRRSSHYKIQEKLFQFERLQGDLVDSVPSHLGEVKFQKKKLKTKRKTKPPRSSLISCKKSHFKIE